MDSTGNGVGDLPGITGKLDYVASLGIDAIWLSPFFTSPMRDFGYDVSNYCDVDRVFGTLANFDALVAKAHALGLKVIIDQVYSHTSDEHEWFGASRADATNDKADWYVWADAKPDGSPPNNWQSVFSGPAWEWDARRGQYYLHNFLPSQPDLNLHNPAVQDALVNVAKFWLERGVDGFRLDAINFAMHDVQLRDNPPAQNKNAKRPFDFQEHKYNQSHADIPKFLERISKTASAYGDIFTVAEVVGADPVDEMKSFTSKGRLSSAYNFDFLYAPEIDAELVRRALAPWGSNDDAGWPAWAFSNHDAPRHVSRWRADGSPRAAKLYAMLLLALRGNAFVFQGEELGLPQADIPFELLQDPEAIANWPEILGRDGARTPMSWRGNGPNAGFSSGDPWLPIDANHLPLAVDGQECDPSSTLHFIRELIAFRKSCPALQTGDMELVDTSDDSLAFYRGDKDALCVFNLGSEISKWAPDAGEFKIAISIGVAGSALPKSLEPMSGYIAIR
ncbi:MAG: alpha-glucosidase [Marinicaulis sp.]|nr:alpha-glucosidase [Marinicaulis sp.]